MYRQFIFKPGHVPEYVSDSSEYGGKKVVCSCGWESRTVGISDNYQLHTLADATRRHVKEADPHYICHCGHDKYMRACDVETTGCEWCGRMGAWEPDTLDDDRLGELGIPLT